jgi:ElaB/YqjD/DUF883 family membrane-anchored ribosome-binding protein
MADTQMARKKLLEDVNLVLADSEELLKAMASAGGEKAQALRGDLGRKLAEARERLDEIEEIALARTREAAKQADEYVHENPWQSLAMAAGLAAIVGIVVGLILNRR